MVATTGVRILLTIYLFWINGWGKWRSQRWAFLFRLMILSALVAMGADRGGRLVFEFGTGSTPKSSPNRRKKRPTRTTAIRISLSALDS